MKRHFVVIITYDFDTDMDIDEVDALFTDVLCRGERIPDLPKPMLSRVIDVEAMKQIETEY